MAFSVHTNGAVLSNGGAGTYPFSLLGGEFGISVTATWGGGSMVVKAIAADGSTGIDVLPPFTADGFALVDLPSGQYELVVATATAVYAAVAVIKA